MNLIKTMKIFFYRIYSKYLCYSTLIEGEIKESNELFKLLFIGNSNFVKYVTSNTFSDRSRILKRSIVWIPTLDKFIKNYSFEYDICMTVIPKIYDDKFNIVFDYKTNVCVRQLINLTGTIDEIKRRIHKRKREISNSIISKSKFTYRISNNLNDFELFYYKMFLPHIKEKYGDMALIESYQEMGFYFDKGSLLFVLSDNQPVAGALFIIKDNTLIMRRLGVLNEKDVHVDKNAQNALYLFLLLHSKEIGLEMIDLIQSISIMNDGVYRTKREWGATVYPDIDSENILYFSIPKYSAKLAEFFEINPFIVHTKDGLGGLVGFNGKKDDFLDAKLIELKNKYHAPGIGCIIVITSDSEKVIKI